LSLVICIWNVTGNQSYLIKFNDILLEMILQEIGREHTDWIDLAQDRDKW